MRTHLRAFLVLALVLPLAAQNQPPTLQERSHAPEKGLSDVIAEAWPALWATYGEPFSSQMQPLFNSEANAQGITVERFDVPAPSIEYVGFGTLEGTVRFAASTKKVIRILFIRIVVRNTFHYWARIRVRLENGYVPPAQLVKDVQLLESGASIEGDNFWGDIVRGLMGSRLRDRVRQYVNSALPTYVPTIVGQAMQAVGPDASFFSPSPVPAGAAVFGTLHTIGDPSYVYRSQDALSPALTARNYTFDGGPDPRLSALNLILVGDGYTDPADFLVRANDVVSAMRTEEPFRRVFDSFINVHYAMYADRPTGPTSLNVVTVPTGAGEVWKLDGLRLRDLVSRLTCVQERAQAIVVVITRRATMFTSADGHPHDGECLPAPLDTIVVLDEGGLTAPTVVHELGHKVGLLGDEYAHDEPWNLPNGFAASAQRLFEVLTPNLTLDPMLRKWRPFETDEDARFPVAYFSDVHIGVGGRPAWRPTMGRCKMALDATQPYCPVCLDATTVRLLAHLPIDLRPTFRLVVSRAALTRYGWTAESYRQALIKARAWQPWYQVLAPKNDGFAARDSFRALFAETSIRTFMDSRTTLVYSWSMTRGGGVVPARSTLSAMGLVVPEYFMQNPTPFSYDRSDWRGTYWTTKVTSRTAVRETYRNWEERFPTQDMVGDALRFAIEVEE